MAYQKSFVPRNVTRSSSTLFEDSCRGLNISLSHTPSNLNRLDKQLVDNSKRKETMNGVLNPLQLRNRKTPPIGVQIRVCHCKYLCSRHTTLSIELKTDPTEAKSTWCFLAAGDVCNQGVKFAKVIKLIRVPFCVFQFAKDEIETLEAITKHPSPSLRSPSPSHQSSCEPTSDCRPCASINTGLHRALEEGTLDTSLDLRGSQEHLLGKIHQTRWYLPSSSTDSNSTPAVKKPVEKDLDLKIKDSDESIASRMKRSFLFSHRSSRVNRQRSNLSMDSFIPPSDETEIPDSAARRICSIERVNEA
ncbi:hypothetical protein ACTXT7_009495 [Hymenolepis weldensis]